MPVWPLGKASVIFLPDGEEGDNLLELAREWTSESLLGLALWVRGADVLRNAGQPPIIQGTVFLPDGKTVSQNVLTQLGYEKLDTVRLIAVRGKYSDQESDSRQNELIKLIGDAIKGSMPLAVQDSQASSTALQTINLICMPTSLERQAAGELLQHSWTANIVASSEDSPAPGHVSNHVIPDANYLGFALAHTAAAAGIWNGVPHSTWDMAIKKIESDNAGQISNNAIVQRVFVRGILSRGLTTKVARGALSKILDPEVSVHLATPNKVQALRPQDVPAYQSKVARHILNFDDGSGQLGRRTLQPAFTIDIKSIGPLNLILMFFKFLWDLIKVTPKWLVGALVRGLSKRLQKKVGDEQASGLRVEAANESTRVFGNPLLHHPLEQNLTLEISRAELELGRTVLRRFDPMSPLFWRRFRSSILRSLDGQKSYDDFDFDEDWTFNAKQLVFPSVNDVFPNELAPWIVNDDQWALVVNQIEMDEVSWSRQDLISSVFSQFEQLIATSNEEISQNLVSLERLNADLSAQELSIEDVKSELKNSGVASEELIGLENSDLEESKQNQDGEPNILPIEDLEAMDDSGEEYPDNADQDALNAWHQQAINWLSGALKQLGERKSELSNLKDSINCQQELLASLKTCQEQFSTWVERIKQTVSVQILDEIEVQKSDLEQEIMDKEAEMRELQFEIPTLLKRLRIRHFRGLVSIIILLVLLRTIVHFVLSRFLSGFLLQLAERFLNIPVGKYVLYAVIAFLIFYLLSTIRFFSDWLKIGKRIETQIQQISWNIESIRLLRSDLKRIQDTEYHARRWLDILHLIVTRPWDIHENLESDLGFEFNAQTLPSCVCIADASTDSNTPAFRGLHEAAVAFNVEPGWREKSLKVSSDEVFRNLFNVQEAGLDRLERDTLEGRTSDKSLMIETIEQKDHLGRVGRVYIASTEKYLREIEISENRPHVIDLNPNPLLVHQREENAGEIEWDDFYRPLGANTSQLALSCFSDSGKINGAGGRPHSFVYGPKRLAPVFANMSGALYLSSEHRGIGEFESMLRVDFTEPIPLSYLSIVFESGLSDPQQLSDLQETFQVRDEDELDFA